MAPWVVIMLWAIFIAGLHRNGLFSQHAPARTTQQFAMPTVRTQLHARSATFLLATVASAPLVFLVAVRQGVGTDYQSYVEMFEQFRAGEALLWIEPLYASLNRLMAPLGSSGVVLVFGASAALTTLPLFYRIFCSSPMPWLGVLILFGLSFPFFMTNIVRQAIAVGVIILAFPAIWRRQFILWSLAILLAAGFHYTALLVWPLYWFLHLAWPRIIALIMLAGAVALSQSREIAVVFLQWVAVLLPSHYSHYPNQVLERLDVFEFGLGYLLYICLAGLVLLVWDRAEKEGCEILVFRNSAFLGLIFLIGLYQFWVVGRLGFYFTPALTVFLPWMIKRCVVRRDRTLWTTGFLALFGAIFAWELWVGSHDAVPYQWIF